MTMVIPTVSSSMSWLRTGAKLFGFLSLIVNLLIVIIEVLIFYHWVPQASDEDFKNVLCSFGINISLDLMQITTSILLLTAIHKEKPGLILPWLVSTVLMAVVELLFFPPIAWYIVVRMSMIVGKQTFSIGWEMITIFTLLTDGFGWLVVYIYYHNVTTTHQQLTGPTPCD